jgi:hypothetical protein
MIKHTHGQTADANTYKNKTKFVTDHTHGHGHGHGIFIQTEKHATLTRLLACFPKTGSGRPSSALSGSKRAATAFAIAASTRTRMRENEERTRAAAKESGDGSAQILCCFLRKWSNLMRLQ